MIGKENYPFLFCLGPECKGDERSFFTNFFVIQSKFIGKNKNIKPASDKLVMTLSNRDPKMNLSNFISSIKPGFSILCN